MGFRKSHHSPPTQRNSRRNRRFETAVPMVRWLEMVDGAGSDLEVSSTSLKLSRRLTLVEYAWKVARKFVYKLVVYW